EGAYRPETDTPTPFSLESGESRPLRIWFAPLHEGDASAHAIFKTDNREFPDFKIPLNGIGVDARATVGARSLDFGRIEAQSYKSKPLEIRNDSPLRVRAKVTPVGPDQDEFVPLEVWLDPGERRDFQVSFLPRRVGLKDVVLSVESCEGCPQTEVQVQAIALD